MTVDFGVLRCPDVLTGLREYLLVSLVFGDFVEPITASEGFLPDLPSAEFVEVLYPHLLVCSQDRRRFDIDSDYVRFRESDEPGEEPWLVYSLLMDSVECISRSNVSTFLVVAHLATFGVDVCPS